MNARCSSCHCTVSRVVIDGDNPAELRKNSANAGTKVTRATGRGDAAAARPRSLRRLAAPRRHDRRPKPLALTRGRIHAAVIHPWRPDRHRLGGRTDLVQRRRQFPARRFVGHSSQHRRVLPRRRSHAGSSFELSTRKVRRALEPVTDPQFRVIPRARGLRRSSPRNLGWPICSSQTPLWGMALSAARQEESHAL
jgi:hypothetical protein